MGGRSHSKAFYVFTHIPSNPTLLLFIVFNWYYSFFLGLEVSLIQHFLNYSWGLYSRLQMEEITSLFHRQIPLGSIRPCSLPWFCIDMRFILNSIQTLLSYATFWWWQIMCKFVIVRNIFYYLIFYFHLSRFQALATHWTSRLSSISLLYIQSMSIDQGYTPLEICFN